jgi:hypothetical protein
MSFSLSGLCPQKPRQAAGMKEGGIRQGCWLLAGQKDWLGRGPDQKLITSPGYQGANQKPHLRIGRSDLNFARVFSTLHRAEACARKGLEQGNRLWHWEPGTWELGKHAADFEPHPGLTELGRDLHCNRCPRSVQSLRNP